jgi:hypothetical protein
MRPAMSSSFHTVPDWSFIAWVGLALSERTESFL